MRALTPLKLIILVGLTAMSNAAMAQAGNNLLNWVSTLILPLQY